MESLLNLVITIVTLFVLISFLVFVHELGHFLAAKFFKVYVKEFAIGFGKTIWSKKYGETVYAIRMIPLGGFVELEGEEKSEGPRSFRNKRAYQKVIILSAGVIMNFLTAIVLFTLFLPGNNYKFTLPGIAEYQFHNVEDSLKAFPITVVTVDFNGHSAGQLSKGETIIGLDGQRFTSYPDFQRILKDSQNKTVKVEFIDLDTYQTSSRELKVQSEDSKGSILNVGLTYDTSLPYQVYFLKLDRNITSGAIFTMDTTFYLVKTLGTLFNNAFSTGNYTQVAQNLGGLPAIANNVNEVVTFKEFSFLIPLAALISISLAIFNILPFPALDGGQAFVVVIESITRKKVPDELLSKINTTGFIILIGLAILVNFKDVIQLGWINSIGNFFKSILGR